MTIASLAMYPFTHLRVATDQFWDSVRSRLSFAAPALDWDLDPMAAGRRDDLILGHTCGWPLVTELATTVRVVGTVDFDVEGSSEGTYASVLVSSSSDELDDILHRGDLIVAANSPDSLSGWISLRSAAAARGVRLDGSGRVEWTGAHAGSVEAVRAGRAHLASIDPVSWVHLGGSGQGLSVVGHGPRIPCLPMITSGSSNDSVVEELRAALTATVHDPAMSDVCTTLKIRDFLRRDLVDYNGIMELAELW